MLNWLKLHFIPHEGNGHRPHILHQKNIHRILGFVVFVEVFAFLIPSIVVISNADTGNVLPSVISGLINQQRQQANLPVLTVNATLNKAAQEKADDMAANQYFAHTSPEGKTPWYWLKDVGYTYSYAGENLAINFTDAQDLTQAWMNSPTHRANILKPNYTQVGTGVAEGTYNGVATIFVAQVFAAPGESAAPVAETPSPAPKVATAVPTKAPAILGDETTPSSVPDVAPSPQVASLPALDVAPQPQPTFLQKIFASPRNTTNIILFSILGLVALALILNVSIKISHHHPDLIMNGMLAIAVVGCVFVMNSYISKSNIQLIQSVGYSIDQTG